MTPSQIEIVQKSFAGLVPQATDVGALFYRNLFASAPQLRPLFKDDLDAQTAKLMTMLHQVVTRLHDLPSIISQVEALARRHVDYGVQPEHYDLVGAALLKTLADGLGERFDASTQEAWIAAYATLSTAMQRAAYC